MKQGERPTQHPAPQAPRMPALQRALDQESYEWMSANQPDILRALEIEIGNGHTPYQARMLVLQHSGREDLAARIEQAARHIEAGR